MHPFHLLTFGTIGVTLLGIVGSIAAMLWSWWRPGFWAPVVLASLGCVLVLPLGILMGLAEVTNGLTPESHPVVMAWVGSLVFVSAVWIATLFRLHQ